MDALATGLVLLDSTAAIIFANRAARALLDTRAGLRLEKGRLSAGASSANTRLQSLLTRVVSRTCPTGGSCALERREGRPLMVRALPLPSSAEGLPRQAVAIVLLRDPDQAVKADEAALATVHLTPAEARLVAGLLAGRTIESFARHAGLRVHTARSTLKAVFEKTGTHRQSELVTLALRSAILP